MSTESKSIRWLIELSSAWMKVSQLVDWGLWSQRWRDPIWRQEPRRRSSWDLLDDSKSSSVYSGSVHWPWSILEGWTIVKSNLGWILLSNFFLYLKFDLLSFLTLLYPASSGRLMTQSGYFLSSAFSLWLSTLLALKDFAPAAPLQNSCCYPIRRTGAHRDTNISRSQVTDNVDVYLNSFHKSLDPLLNWMKLASHKISLPLDHLIPHDWSKNGRLVRKCNSVGLSRISQK